MSALQVKFSPQDFERHLPACLQTLPGVQVQSRTSDEWENRLLGVSDGHRTHKTRCPPASIVFLLVNFSELLQCLRPKPRNTVIHTIIHEPDALMMSNYVSSSLKGVTKSQRVRPETVVHSEGNDRYSGGLDVPICEDDEVGTYILRTCDRLSSDAVEGQGVMLPMQPREGSPAVHGYEILTA
ncbi:hypothetical protein C8Q74DRAFT_1220565 [Fomes fomentarius]|nr:hypothetical protein C8Q74DRAFT_1220565 [Fomes fomentarius]